ncbi:hypothetical protein BRD03_05435 [Halobacteriales archaeon QS_9_68_17]|nr:MAG: hypothetical protein BRD03_05435 [Halobacteriales archaeon QS_9_68_17]
MWPWGHLAVGYLLYAASSRRQRARPPDGAETILIAFGTQFPDLGDKPLAWTVSVLPNGRSLAHSAFVAAAVIGGVRWLCRRADARRRVRPRGRLAPVRRRGRERDPAPYFLSGIALAAVALVVWLRDGAPGPGLVLDRVGVGRAGEADR